ncbi:Hint domain-containing protein [Flavitalea flava]
MIWKMRYSVICIYVFCMLVFLLPGCGVNRTDTKGPGPYSKQTESEDAKYLLRKGKYGRQNHFNYADDVHYRYHTGMLKKAGLNEENRPQLFTALTEVKDKQTRVPSSPKNMVGDQPDSTLPLDTMNIITSLGTSNGQVYASSGVSSVPGGTSITHLVLQLYDKDTIPIGDPGHTEQYNGGDTVFVNTQNQMQSGDTVIAMMSYFYNTPDGGTGQGYTYESGVFYPKAINNYFPIDSNGKSPNLILICLVRMEAGTCDYYRNSASPWPVIFPIHGRAIYFDSIQPIRYDSTGAPINAFASVSLIDPSRSHDGGCQLSMPQDSFFRYVQMNGDTLTWDIPAASFGNACSGNLNPVIYTMHLEVSIKNTGTVGFSITNASGATPNLNTVVIAPMEIAYGCLATGTHVRIKGGKDKPVEDARIESITVNKKVLSGRQPGSPSSRGGKEGPFLTVTSTTIGLESKPMIRIKDDQQHDLLLTDGHPVITTRGILLALQLKIGDTLFTEKGNSRVTSIAKEKYTDHVWNLKVGDEKDGIALTNDNRSFYANGILVGDADMQRFYEKKYFSDSKTILSGLPDKWKKDYQHSLDKKPS